MRNTDVRHPEAMRNVVRGVTMSDMRKLELTDLHRLADQIRKGEMFELWLNGRAIARVEPLPEETLAERVDRLAADGMVRKGTGELPDWFFEEELPRFSGSVLQQLLDDRRSRDW